jgi:hypothetical protein
MEAKDKPGALRLFKAEDVDQPIHGWKALDGQFAQGLVNTRGWAALHVVVQKLAQGVPQKDLYDQMVLVENPGAVVVCTLGQKVGLVKNFRFTAERLLDARTDYIQRLAAAGLWDNLLAALGQWQWELPRGMAPPTMTSADLGDYILKTAKLESSSEAGFQLKSPRICGRLNPNTTFFVHAQFVVAAEIARCDSAQPEPTELIGGVNFFSMEELRQMIANGELEDGLTFAALAMSGFWK